MERRTLAKERRQNLDDGEDYSKKATVCCSGSNDSSRQAKLVAAAAVLVVLVIKSTSERERERERERREVSTTIFGTWRAEKARRKSESKQGRQQRRERASEREREETGQVEVKRPNESGGQCAGGLLNY